MMSPTLDSLVGNHPELEVCRGDIEKAFELLSQSFHRGGKLLICGNGGSAADSEHIVGELMKGYISARQLDPSMKRKLLSIFPSDGAYLADHLQGALPAISLSSQTGLLTAYSNDVAPNMVFAQQVYGYGKAGDVLLGISTSGESKNVLYALKVAKALELCTIGLTGRSGGSLKAVCDVTIRAPFDATADIQERHLAIYHALCAMLEVEFFPGKKQ